MPGSFSSSLSMRIESPGVSCLIEFPLCDSSYLKMFNLIQSQLTNYQEENTSRNSKSLGKVEYVLLSLTL